MPTAITRAVSAAKDKVLSEVLVRFRTSTVGGGMDWQPGMAYLLPAGRAHDFIQSGACYAVEPGFAEQLAREEISIRKHLAG